MAKRQVRDDESAAEVLGNFKQHIFAMARATELLMQREQVRPHADFDPIAVSGAVLAPYAGQFRMDGAAPAIPHHLMISRVLLIHELATNSLKHGALSRETGAVDLLWSEEAAGEVRLGWRESGGRRLRIGPRARGSAPAWCGISPRWRAG